MREIRCRRSIFGREPSNKIISGRNSRIRKRYGSKGESRGNQPHKKAKVLEERKMEEDEKAKGEEAFYFCYRSSFYQS